MDHWQKFESMGEEAVRKAIADNTFGAPRRKSAYEWLEHEQRRDAQEASRRCEFYNDEQTKISRSARNAAWVSAIAAIVAAICAAIAVYSPFTAG